MKNKTLTIMFVDVQGYTSRTCQQTREENQIFVKEIRQFVEKHAGEKGGKLVKAMGDGFLLTFESPTDAVACGILMQKEMQRRNSNMLDTSNFVKLRIGVSTGEVNIDESNDVYGDAVNIAARIEKFTEPNEVFISESTYLAMNKSEIKTMDLGPQKFKNVLEEIRVYKILKDDLQKTRQSRNREDKAVIVVMVAAVAFAVLIFTAYRNQPRGNYFPAGYREVKIAPSLSLVPVNPNAGTVENAAVKNKLVSYAQEITGLLLQGQFDKAAALSEVYLKNEPQNIELLELAGRSFTETGNLEKAELYLSEAARLGASAEIYRQLAAVYEKQGKLTQAVEALVQYCGKEESGELKAQAKNHIEELKAIKKRTDRKKSKKNNEDRIIPGIVSQPLSRAGEAEVVIEAPDKKPETKMLLPAVTGPNIANAYQMPKPAGDFKAIAIGRYDTSKLSGQDRQRCADYFLDCAAGFKNTDQAKADYYATQAKKVKNGEMIEIECKLSDR